jgi:hypothetical protein
MGLAMSLPGIPGLQSGFFSRAERNLAQACDAANRGSHQDINPGRERSTGRKIIHLNPQKCT